MFHVKPGPRGVRMSDVKPGPLDGSERLICWSWAPGDVKMFDV